MTKKAYKKYLKATIATVFVSSGAVVVTANAESITPFPDVRPTDYFFEAVNSLVERRVVKGFLDGTFKPNQNVTRGQAAVIIAGILGLDTQNVTNPGFKDVSSAHPYFGAIAALANAGIIKGHLDGTYKPNDPIQRHHMAVIITNAFKLTPISDKKIPFTDVPESYGKFVSALYDHGVTAGRNATTFAGNAYVSRGQLATFVYRAENVQEQTITIDEITNSEITSVDKTYEVAPELQGLFNESNEQALKGAVIKARVDEGKISDITSLELNLEGEQNAPVTLDGKNSTIGSLIINADFIAVKNLTISGNLTLTEKVKNGFWTNLVKVSSEFIIKSTNHSVAMNMPTVATSSQLITNFNNSSFKNLIVQRDDVVIESDKKLTEVVITESVKKIQIKADVIKVTVNTKKAVTINGEAKIDEFVITQTNSKVELGPNIKIKRLVIPKGVRPEDVILNFNHVQAHILQIQDSEGNPINLLTLPPVMGGGGGPIITPVPNVTITSIEPIRNSLELNSEFSLPETVAAQHSDGTTKNVKVFWDLKTVNTGIVGTQIIEGTVEGYDEKVQLILEIEAPSTPNPTITSIESLHFLLEQNSSFDLPQTIVAQYSDGIAREVTVLWDSINVNTEVVNTQIIEGTVDGFDEKIQLILEVTAPSIPDPIITIIESLNFTVEQNSEFNFPETVLAQYSDGILRDVTVLWDIKTVNTDVVGTQIIEGTVEGYEEKIQLIIEVTAPTETEAPTIETISFYVDGENRTPTFTANGYELVVEQGSVISKFMITMSEKIEISSGDTVLIDDIPFGTVAISSDDSSKLLITPIDSNFTLNTEGEYVLKFAEDVLIVDELGNSVDISTFAIKLFVTSTDNQVNVQGGLSDSFGSVGNAKLKLQNETTNETFDINIESNGLFTSSLPDGDYSITSIYSDEFNYVYDVEINHNFERFSIKEGFLFVNETEAESLNLTIPPISLQLQFLLNGVPVQGNVVLSSNNSHQWNATKTNGNGEIILRVASGEYTIESFEYLGQIYPINRNIPVNAESPETVLIELEEENSVHLFSGMVQDEYGVAIGSGNIAIIDINDEEIYNHYWDIDDTGTFSMKLANGDYKITGINQDDADYRFIPMQLPFSVREGQLYIEGEVQESFSLTLPESNFNGQLLQLGFPLANSMIYLLSEMVPNHFRSFAVITDHRGYFTRRLGDGNYIITGIDTLSQYVPNYLEFEISNNIPSIDLSTFDIGGVRGNVQGLVQTKSGASIEGGSILYLEEEISGEWFGVDVTLTGEFGLDLPDGDYEVFNFLSRTSGFIDLHIEFSVRNGELVDPLVILLPI